MKRNIVILVVIVLMAGIALYKNLVQADAVVMPKEHAPKAGFLAPHFTLEGFEGEKYEVGGPRDKALLINFWASWCGPCELEAPELVKLQNKYRDRLDIYAVNVTKLDTVKEAKAFADKFKFNFPVLLDLNNKVTEMYLVPGYPTNIIVNKHGVIQEVLLGIKSPEELESKIRKAL